MRTLAQDIVTDRNRLASLVALADATLILPSSARTRFAVAWRLLR
jgi:hypothetical protein